MFGAVSLARPVCRSNGRTAPVVTWLKPTITVEVQYNEMTGGRLRAPVLELGDAGPYLVRARPGSTALSWNRWPARSRDRSRNAATPLRVPMHPPRHLGSPQCAAWTNDRAQERQGPPCGHERTWWRRSQPVKASWRRRPPWQAAPSLTWCSRAGLKVIRKASASSGDPSRGVRAFVTASRTLYATHLCLAADSGR